jgi:hypothetical protein
MIWGGQEDRLSDVAKLGQGEGEDKTAGIHQNR